MWGNAASWSDRLRDGGDDVLRQDVCFDDIGCGAERESFLDFDFVSHVRRDDDGDLAEMFVLLDGAQKFKAVHVRQHEVEEDCVKPRSLHFRERILGGGHLSHRVSGAFEGVGKDVRDEGLVLDDEYVFWFFHSREKVWRFRGGSWSGAISSIADSVRRFSTVLTRCRSMRRKD